MTYNTGNAIPSNDPRDLYDNSEKLDEALNSSDATWLDRLGRLRKSWQQIENDAAALVSPSVTALSGLTLVADRLLYSTGPGALNLAPLTAQARNLLDDADAPSMRTTLGAAPTASPAFSGTPTVPTPAAGTDSTLIANTAFVQAEIVNKRAWIAYTPTVTAASGAFTAASATGKYMVIFGVCHFQVAITITTKGTGANAIFTLPFAALAGSVNMPFVAKEGALNGKGGTARINTSLTSASTLDYTGVSGDLASGGNGSVIYVAGSYPIA